MLTKTFIHKEAKSVPGFRLLRTVLTNFAGYKSKLFVIWPFKYINKHTLQCPGAITSNKSARSLSKMLPELQNF
jgi:hypothetical protein